MSDPQSHHPCHGSRVSHFLHICILVASLRLLWLLQLYRVPFVLLVLRYSCYIRYYSGLYYFAIGLVRKKGVMSDLRTTREELYGIELLRCDCCTSRMVHIVALWILRRLQLLSCCWQLLRCLPISCCARLICHKGCESTSLTGKTFHIVAAPVAHDRMGGDGETWQVVDGRRRLS